MFILDANEPKKLAKYLQNQGWLGLEETIVSLSKPGEGNMNYVLRVDTGARTFIVKQSRGYVEKYPQVPAPAARVLTEGAFYQRISEEKMVQNYMPKLIGLDFENNVIALEDLGKANDFTVLYDLKHQLKSEELFALLNYLNGLHFKFQKSVVDDDPSDSEQAKQLANLELRKLNHEHIFLYPFMEDNGFDLNTIQEGLQELAVPYKNDAELKQKIKVLGSLYLSKGNYLLHGDFYPGSWLKSDNGIKIIDPEFCFYGSREFDLGVLLAHLYITQQDETLFALVQKRYLYYRELDLTVLNGFIGAEIMRRLIGLAQLPLQMDLKTKGKFLRFAHALINE